MINIVKVKMHGCEDVYENVLLNMWRTHPDTPSKPHQSQVSAPVL